MLNLHATHFVDSERDVNGHSAERHHIADRPAGAVLPQYAHPLVQVGLLMPSIVFSFPFLIVNFF